jgi:hypothetical protein
MATAYTRDFLVSAFADKYAAIFATDDEFYEFKIKFGYDHFDKVGRDQFRKDCSLNADAIKKYKENLK